MTIGAIIGKEYEQQYFDDYSYFCDFISGKLTEQPIFSEVEKQEINLIMAYIKECETYAQKFYSGKISENNVDITFCVPYVIFNVRARLSGYDISIEEASMDLGANRIRTFWEITLPVLRPGITAGALLAFTLSIDDVIISYFVNGNTMTYPLQVMASIKSGVAPDVNALSALILAGTIIFVVLTQGNLFKKKKQ